MIAMRYRPYPGPGNEIINITFRTETADFLLERYTAELQDSFFWHTGPKPLIYHVEGPRFERAVNMSRELHMGVKTLIRIEEFLLAIMTRCIDYNVSADATVPRWLLTACREAKQPHVFREGAAGFVRAANRGHEHVCRMAKKYLGISPSAFVNEKRMEYAALMLEGSDLNITDIAYECGIENTSHFYRLFHRHYGITPHQYRLYHQKNPVQAN